MRIRTVALTAVLPFLLPASPALAQDAVEFPTPEEYVERAAKAEALPLFQSDEPIKITLLTDIKWLRDVRSDSTEAEGTVTFVDMDGSTVEKPVQVRTRGNWRRNKRNCNFPPLRLNFPTGQMEGTVFEDQDKLKLVTPCHDGRDYYQEYVLKEYLGYKTYEAITPLSFRTRLVEITYVDINDDYDSRTKFGFLIEDEEHMAERNLATYEEYEEFHPARLDAEAAWTTALFNYMIGFTDVSQVYFHNAKLIRTEDARYIPVSYDFDFAGLVNARYASPDPSLPIRRVTDRLFRGYCRPAVTYEAIAPRFLEAKDEIYAMVQGFMLLDEDRREDITDFYDDFYEVMEDRQKYERQITRACMNW